MERYLTEKRKAPGEDGDQSSSTSSVASSVTVEACTSADNSTQSLSSTAEAGPSSIRTVGEVCDISCSESKDGITSPLGKIPTHGSHATPKVTRRSRDVWLPKINCRFLTLLGTRILT
ncbi:unnamed protein product [Ixodes pacificus]